MPNPITEYEREQQKKSIIKHTHQLILERKGIKNITVDDIIRSACMGKSTFYSIYKSKEVCFCDVLEMHLKEVFEKADLLRQEEMTSEERTIRFFREVYLAKDSIVSFINPTVIEVLFRKLPPEYDDKKQMLLSGSVIEYAMGGLCYDETQAEVLNTLFDCIDQTVMSNSISERVREESLNYLVRMMVDFFKSNKYISK
jgi:AcrR family transcriptional regulator